MTTVNHLEKQVRISFRMSTPAPKKKTHISKADELVKGADIELSEEELKRVSGGTSKYKSTPPV
jgi:bacteriocin-like protein